MPSGSVQVLNLGSSLMKYRFIVSQVLVFIAFFMEVQRKSAYLGSLLCVYVKVQVDKQFNGMLFALYDDYTAAAFGLTIFVS